MNIEIDWLTVVLAALATMAVGSLWYSPKIFGIMWEQMIGLHGQSQRPRSLRAIGLAFVASFITALVLSYMIIVAHAYFHNTLMQDAISTAFWAWAGFTATRLIVHDVSEGRNQRLTILNICYQLVAFLVMGVIIGLLAPY